MGTLRAAIGALLWLASAGQLRDTGPPPPALTLPCTVTRVIDGDTVEVEVKLRVRVRLIDCWAPELRENGGQAAKAHLEQTLAGSRSQTLSVPLNTENLGAAMSFERVVGHLWAGDTLVSDEQVRSGHARPRRPSP